MSQWLVPKHEHANEVYSLRLLHVMLNVVTRIGPEGTKDTCGYAHVVSMRIQPNLAIAQRCPRTFHNVRVVAMRIPIPPLQTLLCVSACSQMKRRKTLSLLRILRMVARPTDLVEKATQRLNTCFGN